MPKIGADRSARIFITDKCKAAIPAEHEYIGYLSNVTNDGQVIVIAYSADLSEPTTVAVTLVRDKAVIMAVIKPESAPAPIGRIVKDAPAAPAAPSAASVSGKGKKA